MDNYLFRASMPYCFTIDDNLITVKNRYYQTVFEGFLSDLKSFDFINIFDTDNNLCYYLYDDNSLPLGDSENHIDLDLLSVYFKKLSILLRFCDGILPTNNNQLIK